jgi:PhzF family phenazine biosynthesis protein
MRPFTQVDVFTAEFCFGNPVAVVHEADGLSDNDMAAFANWTNLSETTFLLPPTAPGADYRLRIFTASRELPFAGHPTLGSARAWLAAGGRPAGAAIVQECGAGLVTVRIDGDRLAFAAPPLLRSGPLTDSERARLTAALRVDPARVVAGAWVDNGPGWAGLLLAGADDVLSTEPDAAALSAFGNAGVIGPHPADGPADFEVRAFAVFGGVFEDPVTGSLNAGLGQWLIGEGLAPTSYLAAQGTRLGRRGRVSVESIDGQVWVGGDTVVGVTGSVLL